MVEQLAECVYVGAMERMVTDDTDPDNYHGRKFYIEVYYSPQEHKIVEERHPFKAGGVIVRTCSNMISEFKDITIYNWGRQVEQVYTEFIKKNIRTLFVDCCKCWLHKEIQEKIFPK